MAGEHNLEVTLYTAKRIITTRLATVMAHFYLTIYSESQHMGMSRTKSRPTCLALWTLQLPNSAQGWLGSVNFKFDEDQQ